MQDLNDLFFFASVVEHGGFSAASRALGVPKSRLSRRVAELEQRLNARLLQRNTRSITLTDLGQRFYQHCQEVIAAAEAAQLTITSSLAEPNGLVRVSCPTAIAKMGLETLVILFLEKYPKVRLDFILSNRRINLLEEGIDVAVRARITGDEDPNLATRRLRTTSDYLVAAPALMAQSGALAHPKDLSKLPILGAVDQDRRMRLSFTGPDNAHAAIVVEPRLAIEDFNVRKEVALHGLGITTLPGEYCLKEFELGTLVHVLPAWSLPSGSVQVVYPTQRGLIPAVRVFVDFLSEHLGERV
ncbi:LysR substrate-binding domain-containing protein [Glaciimonas soli]|uniref:LysR family transcriptional regulator n=1 Tax=Glaciimonas soli TaxID=2590999 RepID=A0A843YPC3_9BURK|nr:LysR substrate-binding domain-containing protein [Glaciimonas soli]MQQ99623.1 LysR family transcriptional regulator [Glaciimonas soli]